jgi:hypothetical protein
MLIIEIHVDQHNDHKASTRASQNREDVSINPVENHKGLLRQLAQNFKTWLAVTRDTNFRNNGF